MYVGTEGGEDGQLALVCGHCLWSSETIGLTGDKSSIEKRISEHLKGSYGQRYASLMDQYQVLAKEDVRKQEMKKQTAAQAAHRKGRPMYSKYAAYKREGAMISKAKLKEKLLDRTNKRYDEAKNEWVDTENADSVGLFPVLQTSPEPVDLSLLDVTAIDEVSALDQRLLNVTIQPVDTNQLWPSPTKLLGKRSKRCRVCLHNMIKPELAPDSIRYKMQLFATLHVPTLSVLEVPELTLGKTTKVLVQISNPLDQAVEISLVPKSEAIAPSEKDAEANDKKEANENAASRLHPGSASGDTESDGTNQRSALRPMCTVVRENSRFSATAQVALPTGIIKIAEHDPVHEYQPEEAATIQPEEEKETGIIKRQGNRVVLGLDVTPDVDKGNIKVGFCMRYKYKVTTTGFRSAEKTATTLVHVVTIPVEIDLGSVTDSSQTTTTTSQETDPSDGTVEEQS